MLDSSTRSGETTKAAARIDEAIARVPRSRREFLADLVERVAVAAAAVLMLVVCVPVLVMVFTAR